MDVLDVGGRGVLVDTFHASGRLDVGDRPAVEVDTCNHAAHRPAGELDRGYFDGDGLAGLLDDTDLL